jgi:predicted Zn-dependent protease
MPGANAKKPKKGQSKELTPLREKNDPRVNALLENALERMHAKDYEGSLQVLSTLTAEYPECTPAYSLMGGIYLHFLKQPEKAIPYLQKALQLSPRSETISLRLFHSLWECERYEEALAEMRRFQSIAHCRDYDEILAELKKKGLL